jgi:hypothetical protein
MRAIQFQNLNFIVSINKYEALKNIPNHQTKYQIMIHIVF